jgi:hypothetical protein
MRRACKVCSADLSGRHFHAVFCLPCLFSWSKRTGSARASSAVNRAVKSGKLSPAKDCACVDCGNPARDYDHRDYNKPLQVQPVCRSCNKLRGPALPMLPTEAKAA